MEDRASSTSAEPSPAEVDAFIARMDRETAEFEETYDPGPPVLILDGAMLWQHGDPRDKSFRPEKVTCLHCGITVVWDTRAIDDLLRGPQGVKPGLDLSDDHLRTLTPEARDAAFREQNAYLDTLLPPERPKQFAMRHRCWEAPVKASNAAVALDRACLWLERVTEGRRNNQLNRTAFIEGRAAIDAGIDRSRVEQLLYDAATKSGLKPGETWATIRSGLNARRR